MSERRDEHDRIKIAKPNEKYILSVAFGHMKNFGKINKEYGTKNARVVQLITEVHFVWG